MENWMKQLKTRVHTTRGIINFKHTEIRPESGKYAKCAHHNSNYVYATEIRCNILIKGVTLSKL